MKGPSWLRYQLIAHRGLHSEDAPENTVAAFKRAITKGYAIECDLQLTKDGRLVVFHDETLVRACQRLEQIIDLNCEELKEIEVFGSNQKIIELADLLHLVNGRVPLLLELKGRLDAQVVIDALFKELRSYKGLYAIQSFYPRYLDEIKTRDKEIVVGLLSAEFDDSVKLKWFEKKYLEFLIPFFHQRIDFFAYEKNAIDKPWLQTLRKLKLPILAWTIQSQEEWLEIKDYCDNIIFENFEAFDD